MCRSYMSVGEITVGVMTVGVMRRPPENTVVPKTPSHRVLGHCTNQELSNLPYVTFQATSEIWSHKASGHLTQV